MNVLVTGGCGFIGSNLVPLLGSAGHSIRVLDDESTGARATLGDINVDFVKGSISDPDKVASAVEGMDAIVHLAADTRVMDSIANPSKNFDSNVIGSFTLLEGMRAMGVTHIVAASTGGAILGEVPCPVNEQMVPRPLSPYGASKLAMEGYLSAFGGAYGFTCAALRFSNVYGPGSLHKGSVIASFFRDIIEGEDLTVFGDGEQIRDYVYSVDIAEGVIAALHSKATGVYQLGSGIPTSINQLVAEMRHVVGAHGTFTVNRAATRTGEIRNTYCDISKARSTFGYEAPTRLSEGLAATWEWFQQHHAMTSGGSP